MNNIRPASREQQRAANFMADYFDSVLVGTPNKYGLVILSGLFGDSTELTWTVDPRGRIIVTSDWNHGVTQDYLNELNYPEIA